MVRYSNDVMVMSLFVMSFVLFIASCNVPTWYNCWVLGSATRRESVPSSVRKWLVAVSIWFCMWTSPAWNVASD